ncbi:hypothetical protein [Thalassospira lucentensis]|nr:hypothetical protein [Thalassospira lucentensis]|tara:strand:+ start:2229 stop:2600 length:372 start_codon:yes stop_codon:yes gene_type:complete
MNIQTQSMFNPDGSVVQLIDILNTLSGNELKWSILYFDGIGKAPNSLSMEEFERKIQSEKLGFMMTWTELKKFANELEQTFDCVVAGFKENDAIDKNKILNGDNDGIEIFIEAFDSKEWTIKN